jgi:hypothetical protein
MLEWQAFPKILKSRISSGGGGGVNGGRAMLLRKPFNRC